MGACRMSSQRSPDGWLQILPHDSGIVNAFLSLLVPVSPRVSDFFSALFEQGCVVPMKPDLRSSIAPEEVLPALSPRKGSPPSLALRVLIEARAKARRGLTLTGDVAPSPGEESRNRDLPNTTGSPRAALRPT